MATLQDALRSVAKMLQSGDVAKAFRLLAAELDEQEEREDELHRSILDEISDHYGGGE